MAQVAKVHQTRNGIEALTIRVVDARDRARALEFARQYGLTAQVATQDRRYVKLSLDHSHDQVTQLQAFKALINHSHH